MYEVKTVRATSSFGFKPGCLAVIGALTVVVAAPSTHVTAASPAHVEARVGDVVVVVNPTARPGDERVQVISSSSPEQTAAALDALPGVSASVDQPLHVLADPYVPSQWQLSSAKVPASARATGVVVAVVDTGVDASHPDLSAAVVSGYDALANAPMGTSTDEGWHGTFVSGVIAATADNGVGGQGVAPGAKIMPVKVCNSSGSCMLSDVAEGVVWAYQHGAKVINMSLGGSTGLQALEAAVNDAVAAGAVVVAAAGNSGTTAMSYPAAYESAIAVGSLNSDNSRSSFSQYGSWVELGAPGAGVVSTYIGGGMSTASGTSFSSPMVAGAAALLFAQSPSRTAAQVRSLLLSAAAAGPVDLGGRSLDVTNALAAGTATPPTTTAPTTTAPTTTAPTTTAPAPPTVPPSTTVPPTTTPTSPPAQLSTPRRPVAAATLNGAIVRFSGVYGATAYTVMASSGQSMSVASSPVVFSSLPLDTPVTFTVTATAGSVASAASAQSNAVTPYAPPAQPAAPVASPSDRRVTVSWQPVDRATAYVVTSSLGVRRSVSADAQSVVFSGVPNGVSVAFTVTARRGGLSSPASAWSAEVVPAGAPKFAGRPKALAMSDGRVFVSWIAPWGNGSDILSVTVTASTGESQSVTGNVSSTSFSGLVAGTATSFTVTATNRVGSVSQTSSSVTVRTGVMSLHG